MEATDTRNDRLIPEKSDFNHQAIDSRVRHAPIIRLDAPFREGMEHPIALRGQRSR